MNKLEFKDLPNGTLMNRLFIIIATPSCGGIYTLGFDIHKCNWTVQWSNITFLNGDYYEILEKPV